LQLHQRRVRGGGGGVVVGNRLRRAAPLFELRDVRARDERLVAAAAQHDDADVRVAAKIGENPRHRRPHLVGHGVAALGIVENHPADRMFFLRE
jgi:hypothetical protein